MSIIEKKGFAVRDMEQRIRRCMCVAAAVAGAIGLVFNAGWISEKPTYDRLSWYLVSEFGKAQITKHYDDESTCRQQETATAGCHSGTELNQG